MDDDRFDAHLAATLARDDPHPEVRRTPEKARQRVVLWWRHFGAWEPLLRDAPAVCALVRALIEESAQHAALRCAPRSRRFETRPTPSAGMLAA